MANRERGEVGAQFRGEDIALVLDFNAICALEEHYDEDIDSVLARLDSAKGQRRVRARDLRRVVLELMRASRPGATEADAGDFITEIGLARLPDLLSRVIAASRMVDAAPASEARDPRPPETGAA
ncbi:GTA-gp10 family protein [Rhodovulum kholense]|uniref:Tail tube GTA-gp10-like protein n=1 Tax=Rhodovulum kholense TaxID=453584 RepID=A0A8E2VHG8_9RHOB|nr:GTA-gp10 family protein [Rhodovulum kholense]PTW45694.1 tail tube GTA-gp10-like protein [Rhodovulum kholense]